MRSFVPALCAIALLATASGCGSTATAADTDPAGEAYVALVDVSYSTVKARAAYAPALLELAGRAAQARAPLYGDAFDGNPSSRIRWRVQGHFDAELPDIVKGNDKLTKQYLEQQARKLEPQLEDLLDERTREAGSPLGPTLKAAAGVCEQQRPRTCKVYVFTDGVFIGDDFDARKGGATARDRLVERWADRLDGLAGAEVSFVGVGYGTRATDRTQENSKAAAKALLRAAGAKLADWNVSLAPA